MVPDHRVKDDQELTHAGGEGDLLGLACCQEPLIEGAKDWIVAHRDQGRHIESGAHSSAPAPAGPLPPALAAVTAERGYANKGGDLPAGEGAQFRETGQQREGQGRADAWHAAQEVFTLTPQGTLPQAVIKVPIEVMQLPFQDGEHPIDALLDHGQRSLAALLLGDLHLDDLPPAGNEGFQFSSLCGSQGLGHSPAGLAEMGDGCCVETICLSQLPQGASEVADLTGIDHGDRDVRCTEGHNQGNLIAAGGFQHHQPWPQLSEPLNKGFDTCFILSAAPSLPRRANSHIHPILGYIDSDEHLLTINVHFYLHGPSLHDAGLSMPRQLFGLLKTPGGVIHAELRSWDQGQYGLPRHYLRYKDRPNFPRSRAHWGR